MSKTSAATAAAKKPEPSTPVQEQPSTPVQEQPSTPVQEQPTAKTQPGLRVRSCSPRGAFRRAGLLFETAPTELALADLSREQIKAIKEEPLLVVEDIKIQVPEPQADT